MMAARPTAGELRRGEAAASGRAAAAGPQRAGMLRLVSWKPLAKGSLRGFATVELPIGLKLIDCPVYVGKNGGWASLPSKPQLDRDGRRKTDINGHPAYSAVLEWRSRELADRWSAAVVALVRQAHLEDLEGEAST